MVYLFLAGAQTTVVVMILIIFFSPYRYLIAIYFTHYFLDADKPENGSRPISWCRNNKFWNYARDYFPVILVKERNKYLQLLYSQKLILFIINF